MIYRERDKVMIRIGGKELQFGDIAFIKAIDYGRLLDTHLCHCPLREVSEWMIPSHFDKFKEPPPIKRPIYDRIKNAAKDIDAEKKQVERPPAVYTNLKSGYKYDADE